MKIRVRQLHMSDRALPVSGEVTLDLGSEYTLQLPARFQGECLSLGDGMILVTGTLCLTVHGACARCTKPASLAMEVPFSERFTREEDEEEEIYPYFGDELDLQPALQEAALMALPTRLLCKEDCRGLCPVCGADNNERNCGCIRNSSSPFSVLKQLDLPEEV